MSTTGFLVFWAKWLLNREMTGHWLEQRPGKVMEAYPDIMTMTETRMMMFLRIAIERPW